MTRIDDETCEVHVQEVTRKGWMKHVPNGREESETARDWDPRTHEQTARDWDPRTHEEKSIANSRRTSTFDNRYRKFTKHFPRDVTTAQGPEHDGAYLEPVTCFRRSVKAQTCSQQPAREAPGREER